MSYHAIGADPAAPLEPGVDYRGDISVPSICPPCSYLDAGTCKWCPDNSSDIPGCEGCVDHKPPEQPWYTRADILYPAIISVGTTVAATLVTAYLMRQWRMRQA